MSEDKRGRSDNLKTALYTLWGVLTLILLFAVALLLYQVTRQQQDLAILTAPITPYMGADGGFGSRSALDVRLYFASEDRTALESEMRRIGFTELTVDNCRATLDALIEGLYDLLAPILPASTQIRGMYLLENGELVIDFSRDLEAGLIGSATSELLMVQGVVASMCQPALRGDDERSVSSVRFLFEGSPAQDTFPVHIDLSAGVLPDAGLIDVGAQDRDRV